MSLAWANLPNRIQMLRDSQWELSPTYQSLEPRPVSANNVSYTPTQTPHIRSSFRLPASARTPLPQGIKYLYKGFYSTRLIMGGRGAKTCNEMFLLLRYRPKNTRAPSGPGARNTYVVSPG